ncbi:MAG: hypothetical protein ACRDHZ_17220 [Ktedonobacteraceae bacterium]
MALLWENRKINVTEYLNLNEHDPDDGEVYMRPIEYVKHAVIGANAGCLLGNGLEDSPYVVYNSMAWIQLAETRYVYPDLTVACDLLDSHEEDDAQIIDT